MPLSQAQKELLLIHIVLTTHSSARYNPGSTSAADLKKNFEDDYFAITQTPLLWTGLGPHASTLFAAYSGANAAAANTMSALFQAPPGIAAPWPPDPAGVHPPIGVVMALLGMIP